MTAEIIDLAKAREERESGLSIVDESRERKPGCRHPQVDVWQRAPRVECRDCGERLDPHQVLLAFALEERKFQHIGDQAERKRAALKAEIAELEAEEKRIKSRIRNARKREEG